MRKSMRNQKKRKVLGDSDTEEDTSHLLDEDRDTKPGSKWTQFELEFYKIEIRVVKEDLAFFHHRIEDVVLPDIPKGILTRTEPLIEDNESFPFLQYLYTASDSTSNQESDVNDFAVHLLNTMGYRRGDHLIHTCQNIPLLMCKRMTNAETDVCVKDSNGILLLIQEDKKDPYKYSNAEAQLIAEAIAAFQYNNIRRKDVLDIDVLDSYLFPGITMVGTYPTFYKITVTNQLDTAISHGDKPKETTYVERFNPIEGLEKIEGMKPIKNRIRILKCFELFKQFVATQSL
jgi:hypothetical protein